MCAKCDTLEHDLTVEILLAQAEAELILAQASAGESVPGAIRPLSAAEKRAKMRFGEIHDLEQNAADEAAKLLAGNAQVYIMAVISAIFGADNTATPAQIVKAFERLARGKMPAAAVEAADKLALSIGNILEQVYAGASLIALGEASRQGVEDLPPPLVPAAGQFAVLAGAVALHPWTRLTTKLQTDMLTPKALQAPAVKADVMDALKVIPLDGATDLAHQSINVAHAGGRFDTAKKIGPAMEVTASELLDGRTCDRCSAVDGKVYDSLEAGLVEYEQGFYGACRGGSRCRGTLTILYGH
jgi:hypothetical protein